MGHELGRLSGRSFLLPSDSFLLLLPQWRARDLRQDNLTLNILGSAVSNFIRISDGCISIEETKELA